MVDGHCTEHIRLCQMLSKLYKQLQYIETDSERLYALYQRRIDLLQPLLNDINPNVYYNFVQEMQVEFQELYGELYDMKYKDIESGRVKKTKKRLAELNDCLRKSITNAKLVCEALMKYEEKFDYL